MLAMPGGHAQCLRADTCINRDRTWCDKCQLLWTQGAVASRGRGLASLGGGREVREGFSEEVMFVLSLEGELLSSKSSVYTHL